MSSSPLETCLQLKEHLLSDYSIDYIQAKYAQYIAQEDGIIALYEKVFSKEGFREMFQVDANLGFFTFMILEDKAFESCINIKLQPRRLQILNHILSIVPCYKYLYSSQYHKCSIYKFFSRMFEYYELIQIVIHLFQYDFNKDTKYVKHKQSNLYYGHFQFMVDVFKYIISLNPSDPTKILGSYSQTLSEEVLTNIFYKRYSLLQVGVNLQDINLYDAIIDYPCLTHNHLVNIYQECICFDKYVLKYVQTYKQLNNMIKVCELFLRQEYCQICMYDIMKEDIVQFDCGHQFCQNCFVRMFLKTDISYLSVVVCPWCKKETKHLRVPSNEDKTLLLRQLPTEECLRYVFKKVSYKKIYQQTDVLCLRLLTYKYNLSSK